MAKKRASRLNRIGARDARGFITEIRIDRTRAANPNAFPLTLPALRSAERIPVHSEVTFFIGENGCGKSTLVEGIAGAFGLNPEGGSRNFGFSTRASHSNLADILVLGKGFSRPSDAFFLRAESYFNLATEIERLDKEPGGGPPIIASYGGVSLHEQSHGESFLALLNHRFHSDGLYILDEPEAALSPRRLIVMLAHLRRLIAEGCQFIIATHSPILMAYPGR
ncbi:MAG TPA: AAA family ATPase [Chthonomonadaceae bacterium]|nr:AAA family ATPase [Chthonomonadaceae bacterium]